MVLARGRRHAKISKLYLTGLLKRGPNIFVALAWSQVSVSCGPVAFCGLVGVYMYYRGSVVDDTNHFVGWVIG